MDSTRLQYLIDRYLAKLATNDELNELLTWYNELDYGSEGFDQWAREFGGEENLMAHLHSGFAQTLERQKRSHKIKAIYRTISIAAIFAIVFGGWFFYSTNSQLDKKAANKNVSVQIVPGKNTAILTLSDGAKVMLDNAGNGAVARQANMAITKTKTGTLAYTAIGGANDGPGKVLFNTVSTPRGGQFQIKLPDGTEVWLNAESSIKYPVVFSKTERRVELTGEAYFEVTHNAQQPFKVITNNQEIKVLGTHFDVKGYSDEQTINTTLLQGSVLVSNLRSKKTKLLQPGQQSVISLINDDISVNAVNVSQVVSWKNGYFLFDQMNIASIMKIMSRWYDVDVQYNDFDKSAVFGGTFSRNANIKDILNNLQILGQVHFQIEGRKIIVSK
ncbi:MAG: FecR family protein [Bacteroidota bacterium]